jgi:hypothetical protein
MCTVLLCSCLDISAKQLLDAATPTLTGTHSTPAFEPAGSDSDEAIAARAKASLQVGRGCQKRGLQYSGM